MSASYHFFIAESHMRMESDFTAIDWIARDLHDFGKDVGSVIPPGFDAYARIMHPIELRREKDHVRRPIRWSELAALQTRALAHVLRESARTPALTIDGCEFGVEHSPIGSLTANLAQSLTRILASQTQASSKCFFALWDGWGTPLPEPAASRTRYINRRSYHLFAGTIDEAAASLEPEGYMHRSANLWWPDEHSWIVATEIDFHWTYVAGSRECIAAVLASEAFEAYPTSPSEPNLLEV